MKADEICHVTTTSFHNTLRSDMYPVARDRYWLFTSKLCPFAHRTEIVRSYLGIENDIGLMIAGSVQTSEGWNLGQPYKHNTLNPAPKIDRLPALYELASPGYTGRASVPVLFDKKTNTIVNNESAEIIRQLDEVFNNNEAQPSLCPAVLRDEIDAIITLLAEEFIGPLYQAGFAQNQDTYRDNCDRVFCAIDKLEQYLSRSGPYLTGDQVTLADVHAFAHLSRFDAVYHSLYRLNLKFIRDYPRLSVYMKHIAKVKGFSDTLDIEAVKKGYFLSWNQPKDRDFVPLGPPVDQTTGVALAVS